MTDFSVVGHIAIDRIITSREERIQLGGPPTYISIISEKLGRKINVVTKFGRDMPDDFLQRLKMFGISVKKNLAKEQPTTKFSLDYRKPDRSLCVESICQEIGTRDLENISDCVLLTPIVGEIQTDSLTEFNPEILALDPQGLVRDIQPNGTVRLKEWFDEKLLERLTIYKSSQEELALITGHKNNNLGLRRLGRLGIEIAIVTSGGSGSQIIFDGDVRLIPAYQVANALDPTGAGDVFIGAFFMEYLKGDDPFWCASMGSASASFVVKTRGPEVNASRRQIEERAEEIYEAISKL